MQDTPQVRVESLFVYPIKSCAGTRVPRLQLNASGAIEGDREWVVIDASRTVVWQGSHPRLALVKPALHDATLVLSGPDAAPVLSGPDAAPVEIARQHCEHPCELHLWNDAAQVSETWAGFDAGDRAAAFLQQVTGTELRLVRLDSNAISRGSVNQLHLSSVSSLHELNQFLAMRGGKHAAVMRFRPNIVLDSVGEPLLPFVEEQFTALRWLSGGQMNKISVYGRCVRCILPNVDPETAEVREETAAAVAELSAERYPGEPSYFGVYGKALQCGALTEGDVLDVELNF